MALPIMHHQTPNNWENGPYYVHFSIVYSSADFRRNNAPEHLSSLTTASDGMALRPFLAKGAFWTFEQQIRTKSAAAKQENIGFYFGTTCLFLTTNNLSHSFVFVFERRNRLIYAHFYIDDRLTQCCERSITFASLCVCVCVCVWVCEGVCAWVCAWVCVSDFKAVTVGIMASGGAESNLLLGWGTLCTYQIQGGQIGWYRLYLIVLNDFKLHVVRYFKYR